MTIVSAALNLKAPHKQLPRSAVIPPRPAAQQEPHDDWNALGSI
jgi:hypothetical protein